MPLSILSPSPVHNEGLAQVDPAYSGEHTVSSSRFEKSGAGDFFLRSLFAKADAVARIIITALSKKPGDQIPYA